MSLWQTRGSEVMSFWDLPNFEKTAKKTDLFLCKQCERLALRAGIRLTDLSSPQLSFAPAHSNAVNHTENNLQHGLEAIEALQAIRYTMDRTAGISPQILTAIYLKHDYAWHIEQKYCINHNSYPRLRKTALNQFAECWEMTQDVYDWEEEDRVHLQVYDKEREK